VKIPDTSEFAFSFSHGVVKVNDRQFTRIGNVRVNQEITESAVYGTARGPLGRSAGQLGIGSGLVKFSDYREGTDFLKFLGTDPMFKTWTLDYSLILESGTVRSIECQGCRILAIGVDHSSGPEALEVEYPFSFLSMKVDGLDVALSVGALAKLGVQLAQNLLNQL
jgi:hypothetical protein